MASLASSVFVFVVLLMVVASPLQAEALRLSIPLDCSPLNNCFIQNYVDVDPTTAVHDYKCNKASYDGHKGVDFRISSIAGMMEGVPGAGSRSRLNWHRAGILNLPRCTNGKLQKVTTTGQRLPWHANWWRT